MPSSEPRSRRSGQVPSCTPATTTRSHSRPLDRCAVRTAHRLARLGPLGQRVAGDLLAGQAVQEQPRRPRRQPVGEPGRRVEQRDHRVQVGVGRGAPAAARRAGRLPRRGQAGGVPHGPQHVVRGPAVRGGLPAPAMRPAMRRAAASGEPGAGPVASGWPGPPRPRRAARPAGQLRGGPARQGQPGRVAQRGGQRLPPRAARRPRPRRRAATGAGGAGPARRSRRAARSAARRRCPRSARPAAARSRAASSSGRVPGSAASGSSSPATATGTPAVARARCSSGTWRAADRTSTAMDDQGTPSIRWARRRVSAITAASWLALAAVDDPHRAADSGPASGTRSRWPRTALAILRAPAPRRQPAGHPAGRGQQHRAAAAAGAQRDHGGRLPVRRAEPVGEPAHRVHVRAAEARRSTGPGHRPRSARGRRRPARAAAPPGPGRCPGTRRPDHVVGAAAHGP